MVESYIKQMGRHRKKNKNFPQHLQIKAGWYYYVIRLKGKYKWFPLKTQDLGDALKRWSEIETSLKQDLEFDLLKLERDSKVRISFSALVKRFFEDVYSVDINRKNKEQKLHSTVRNYKRMALQLIDHFKEIPVHKVSRQDIIRYHDSLRETPYEANRRIVLLHIIFQKALDWGYLSVNPASRIKKFKERKHILKLTEEILFKDIYPVAQPMLKRAIMLAFHLCQHENEVKRLQWKDFDFSKQTVKFIRKKTGEEICINYSSNPALISFLEYLRTSRRELSTHIICRSSKKGWITYQHFRSMWYKALEKAKYEKGAFKFKEIRHLANTLLKDADIPADKRKAMTGHKTIQANEVYTHPSGTDTIDSSRALSTYRPDTF